MDPGLLRRPWRLLRTRWPWTCAVYLTAQVAAGWVAWFAMGTFVLAPVWAKLGARIERRLVTLTGRKPLPAPPQIAGLSWREVTHLFVTATVGVVGTLAGVLACIGTMGSLLAPLWLVVEPPDLTFPRAGTTGAHLAAGALGLALLPVVLWGLSALAVAYARLSAAILSPRVEQLEAQVDALTTATVRAQDQLVLERRLLQRRLHDGAQLQLSVAGVRLGLLEYDVERLPPGAEQEDLRTGVQEVRDRLDAAVDEIRDAAQGLAPRVLHEDGLGAALRGLVRDVPLHVSVDAANLEGVDRIDEGLHTDLYLIASEAVTNVVKHARAANVAIAVRLEGADVVLVIEDDGVGGVTVAGGGILGMAARARRLGGTFHLDSPEGGPTRLTVRIPRDADARSSR